MEVASPCRHTCSCTRVRACAHTRFEPFEGWLEVEPSKKAGEIMNKALQGSTAKVVDGRQDVYKSTRAIYAGSLGH